MQRRKSHGANFDIDLGGTLGFGFHVARSAIELLSVSSSRVRREQQQALDEFLEQQRKRIIRREQVSSTRGLASTHTVEAGTGLGGAEAMMQAVAVASDRSAEWNLIQQLMNEVAQQCVGPKQLNFASWRWLRSGKEAGWRITSSLRRQQKRGLKMRQSGLRKRQLCWWVSPLPQLLGCWWRGLSTSC